mmetsp:Transcript_50306/g.80108  ORF Transcript_50306/g.80108 Transcript_50306/m.80108 type:complete len:101 (+) Transcript_50306:1078-1380(+)
MRPIEVNIIKAMMKILAAVANTWIDFCSVKSIKETTSVHTQNILTYSEYNARHSAVRSTSFSMSQATEMPDIPILRARETPNSAEYDQSAINVARPYEIS